MCEGRGCDWREVVCVCVKAEVVVRVKWICDWKEEREHV